MYYSIDKVINGIVDYADAEVMGKLPTSGKWLVGAGVNVISTKADTIAHTLQNNPIMRGIDIVNDEGFDIDTIAQNLYESASKYGKLQISIPFLGTMTFSASDIQTLKGYIERA